MTSRRNILLTITILAFFLSAPLITLYTAGYRYNFKKNHLERVGFFETSTVPANATTLIDGNIVGKTPYVDTGIFPGNYELKLSKDGYHAYNSRIEVRSGIASLLLNVLLFKDTNPELVNQSPANAILSKNGSYIAWIESAAGVDTAMISLTSGDKKRTVCALKPGTTQSVLWNDSGESVLFLTKTSAGAEGCLTSVSGNTYALNDFFTEKIINVEWSPFDNNHLLIRAASGDYAVAFERKEKKLASSENVPFTIRGSRFFGVRSLKTGAELWSQSLSVLPINFGPEKIMLGIGDYTFLPSPEKYLVLKEARSGRIDVYDSKNFKRLNSTVADSLVFDSTGKSERFLAVSDFELTLVDLKAETSHLIVRYSEPITNVVWHPLEGHAIAYVNGEILAIPFENSAERTVHLAKFESTQSIWIDSRGDTLFIVGTSGAKSGVWKLVLKE